ncbi:MAG: disulfide bond formation protein DsbB [Idiomarina sp.]|uniref:disulfide bond formation protein DsbB n=1 Tax=Idiomarina sp. TaxID=1874361 RepID=UPI000C120F42|nr:disulfide bond formation protein DsbB [Idiomarina sp.]MAK71652.1 disulfide bond formation protein DsbB [Idiomarinaceae bacterium]MBL4741341.1 disulfide bond formation protein DsbB [Idiomarina sp.]MBT43317.1 disulfide bond formation protein DsbB [Idiomarina sp.]PHQ78023.1 MAG: disulfide bond formation protein DsbB [Idiomarina sp.]HAD47964.1 disulfide bond formation protein DsbB [Idiomarina sp.]
MTAISQWPTRQTPWLLLFLGSTLLFILALYFQHAMALEPCVKCVYQRVAVVGVMLSALVGGFGCKFWLTRWLGIVGWGYSSFEGLRVAYDHWDLQTSKNAFFAVCESAPNFPDWAPLHQWLPGFFAAPGLCGDIDWEFLGIGMPGWMTFIFGGFLLIAVIVALLHLSKGKRG